MLTRRFRRCLRGKRTATRSTTKRAKLLDEFSKISFLGLELVGVGNLVAYWCAVFAGLAPEPDVAVTGIVELIAPYIGYCALQLGLKASLNKNKLKIGTDGTVVNIDAEDSDEKAIDDSGGEA